ncbi:MAG: glycosyltransferase family 87 protein [Candidatus Melainabacteria bacterium]|nr:glycosyltransferase family 87 protein [Candidatus Melainabacteria bacterium]
MSTRLFIVRVFFPCLFALTSIGIMSFFMVASAPTALKVSDGPQYYGISRMLADGKGPRVYAQPDYSEVTAECFPELKGRKRETFLAPFSLPWLWPLHLVPANIFIAVWTVFLGLALLASLLILAKTFNLQIGQTAWFCAFLFLSGSTYESLRIGQLAPLLILSFSSALFFARKEKWWLVGIALSLLILKPQELLPIAVALVAGGRWKWIPAFATCGLILLGLSYLMIGAEGYAGYSEIMRDIYNNNNSLHTELAPTIRGQLLLLFPQMVGPITTITTVINFAGIALIALFSRKLKDSPHWMDYTFFAALPFACVTALYWHSYDLLLLMPVFAIAMKNSLQKEIPIWLLLTLLPLVAIFILPTYILVHYNYLLAGSKFNPFFLAMLVFTVVCSYIAIKMKKLDTIES